MQHTPASAALFTSSSLSTCALLAGISLPHVRHEPSLQQGVDWACYVLWSHGRGLPYWPIR